jgi:hypothetical protein
MRALLSGICGAIVLLLSPLTQAEPTKTMSWLMDEPMSLFDWGIYKTNKKLSDLKISASIFKAEFFFASAEYDWDVNRIRLRVMFTGNGTEAECTENLKLAKGAFLDFKWDEKEQIRVAPTVLRGLFSHEGGYQSKKGPTDVGDELAKIATIEAFILVKAPDGSYSPKAKCQADFRSATISVIRQ